MLIGVQPSVIGIVKCTQARVEYVTAYKALGAYCGGSF